MNPMVVSEARFQAQVIQMARTFRWRVAHFRPGMDRRGRFKTAVQGDGEGFPDIVIAHLDVPDVIHAEIKSEKGKLSPKQEEWLRILNGVVWRPSDFDQVRARLMVHHVGPRRGDDAPAPACTVPGCVRLIGHPGFHTSVQAIAKRVDAA